MHFNQIMVLMNEDARFHVEQPRGHDASIIAAAGGVASAQVASIENRRKKLAEHAAKRASRKGGTTEEEYQTAINSAAEKPALSVTEEDLTIPPMLRHYTRS